MKNYLKEKTIHPTINHIREAFEEMGYMGMNAEQFYDLSCDNDFPILENCKEMVMVRSKVGFPRVMLFKCCLVQVASTEELAQKRILMRMGYQLPEYEQRQIDIDDALHGQE